MEDMEIDHFIEEIFFEEEIIIIEIFEDLIEEIEINNNQKVSFKEEKTKETLYHQEMFSEQVFYFDLESRTWKIDFDSQLQIDEVEDYDSDEIPSSSVYISFAL